eukprot:7640875-Alexandrium_andersonii.AAC.1
MLLSLRGLPLSCGIPKHMQGGPEEAGARARRPSWLSDRCDPLGAVACSFPRCSPGRLPPPRRPAP